MRALLIGGAAVLLAGCGGPGTEAKPPSKADFMTEMKEFLIDVQKQKKKPPAKPADLNAYEPIYPGAVMQLRRGEIVYAWGVGLGTGTAVLAYPKTAGESGGTVLLEDGTLKEMTAAEFNAAPKAGKK